jgi:hypothetical protein
MKPILCLIMLLVLLAPCDANATERMGIRLHEQAEVTTEQVTLGQVATLPGESEGMPWATLDLGSAPPPGYSRVIELGYVRLRARRHGLQPDEVDWQGDRVRVSRPPLTTLSPSVLQPRPAVTSPAAGPAEPLVRRGQLVEVIVRCRGVVVRGSGRALAEGSLGERVGVSLGASTRPVSALITQGPKLLVELTGGNP